MTNSQCVKEQRKLKLWKTAKPHKPLKKTDEGRTRTGSEIPINQSFYPEKEKPKKCFTHRLPKCSKIMVDARSRKQCAGFDYLSTVSESVPLLGGSTFQPPSSLLPDSPFLYHTSVYEFIQ
ncbi:hypothetical protein CEXT_547321 [Caerostris extrusa]|uniref:Uncharacterized protein n=1 Tax=Caerostris extrusa TaxID=172846 RepID=A0AAV4WDD9_CAEEX|nr:hypothetical protein CEXT_547321 [Caerostris extrusa]